MYVDVHVYLHVHACTHVHNDNNFPHLQVATTTSTHQCTPMMAPPPQPCPQTDWQHLSGTSSTHTRQTVSETTPSDIDPTQLMIYPNLDNRDIQVQLTPKMALDT